MKNKANKCFAVEEDLGIEDIWASDPDTAASLVRKGFRWSDYESPLEHEPRGMVFDQFTLRWDDDDGTEQTRVYTVIIEPDPPSCPNGDHEWSDREVRGSGGGVIITSSCNHCQWILTESTWGTNPINGTGGHTTIAFHIDDSPPDDEEWLEDL